MVKLKLSVKDRLVLPGLLPGLLPGGGPEIGKQIVNNIIDRVKFSPAEIERYMLRDKKGGDVIWNLKKEKTVMVKFYKSEFQIMKNCVALLINQKKMTAGQFDLCKRINDLKI